MAKDKAVSDSGAVQEVPVIIEKYLAGRADIASEMKRVLCKLYRGQLNSASRWTEIVNKRLSKPAD